MRHTQIKWHKTVIFQILYNARTHLHVLREVEAPDVCRRDDPLPRQLPNVELVHGQDAVNILQKLLLQGVDLGKINKGKYR